MSRFAPCDIDEEMPPMEDGQEELELVQLLEEYDRLFEQCMTTTLPNEDSKALNEIHGCLRQLERANWGEVSDEFVDLLASRLDTDFPFIRYQLGMLPDTDF